MRTPRIIALIIGVLLVVPGLSLLAGGAALGVADVRGRESGGYVAIQPSHLESSTTALVSPALAVVVDADTPQWVLDRLATDVRLTVAGDAGAPIFVGVARTSEVDTYLAGAVHDEITTHSGTPDYRRVGPTTATAGAPSPPAEQSFWAARATGQGTVSLDWKVASGSWSVVLMNADGSPGVVGLITPSVRSDALGPLALTLLIIGVLITLVAAATIVLALRGRRPSTPIGSAGSLPPTPVLTR